MKVSHYLTKYVDDGCVYAESWIQVDAFGRCWCFSRRKIVV